MANDLPIFVTDSEQMPEAAPAPAEKKSGATEEQLAAIHERGGRILLSASAGSGKTFVLVKRVLELVREGVPIGDMLIVAFNTAAAAEMRKKIGDALKKEWQEEEDEKKRRILRRQILSIPQAHICTMDKFFLDVTRRNFRLLGISPDFRVLMGPELDLTRHAAMSAAFENLYEQKDSAFLACVEAFSDDRSDTDLFDLGLMLADEWDKLPDMAERMERFIEDMDPQGRNKDALDNEWMRELCRCKVPAAQELYGEFSRLADYALENKDLLSEAVVNQRLEEKQAVKEVLEKIKEGQWPGTIEFATFQRKSKKDDETVYAAIRNFCNNDGVRNIRKKFKELFNSEKLLAQEEYTRRLTVNRDLTRGFAVLMKAYRAEFERLEKKKNAYALADIMHLAYSLFVARYDAATDEITLSDYALSLPAGTQGLRITEVLIDEFQDTNLIQQIIFRAVSGNGEHLFSVGDLKQSIYRFRSADPSLFADQLRTFSREDGEFPRALFLRRNFRSTPQVLGFVNFLFAHILHAECGGVSYDETQWAYPGAEFPAGDYDTELLLYDNKDPENEEAAEEEEASQAEYQGRVCGERIRELMNSGRQVRDAETKQMRPISYNDIIILSYASRNVSASILKGVRDWGIPVYSVGAESYLDFYEVKFVLAFLRAVDNPYLDIPLTAALRSPIFAFTAQELCDLRESGKGCLYDQLRRSTNEKAVRAVEVLERYRMLAQNEPVYRLIWRLYGEFSLFAVVQGLSGDVAGIRAENLRLIYRHAREYEQSSLHGLYGFLSFIRRIIEQAKKSEGNNPAPSAPHVTVSTIHKVKGLEYPFVFVVGLDSKFIPARAASGKLIADPRLGLGMQVRERARQLKYDTPARRALVAKEKSELIAEKLRLYYVAFTRAKEKLFLVGHVELNNPDHTPAACKKMARGATGAPVTAGHALDSATMLDLILTALMHHPSGRAFASRYGVDIEGELSENDRRILADCMRPAQEREAEEKLNIKIRIMRPHIGGAEENEDRPAPFDFEAALPYLDYEYPGEALRGIPAKVSVSDLKGLREMDEDAGLMLDRRPDLIRPAFAEPSLTTAEKGTALHKFMQYMNFADPDLAAQLAAMEKRGTLSAAETASLDPETVRHFTQSEIFKEICRAKRVEREYRFLSRIPVGQYNPALKDRDEHLLLQGVIDLFYETPQGLVLLDYKTDRNPDPAYYREHYALQLALYAEALTELTGLPVIRKVIYSFSAGREIDL